MFPVHLLQGLQTATPEQLAVVEVSPSGYGLHWESLDADLAVPALMSQIFGSGAWISRTRENRKDIELGMSLGKRVIIYLTVGSMNFLLFPQKIKLTRNLVVR